MNTSESGRLKIPTEFCYMRKYVYREAVWYLTPSGKHRVFLIAENIYVLMPQDN
jgi:hypothetical protein